MTDIAQLFITESRKYLRAEFLPRIERCLERLDDQQIWWRPNSESNSIGNLLLHLDGNVRQWIISGVGGAPDTRVRQREFDERSIISGDSLLAKLRSTLEEVDRVLAQLKPEDLVERRKIQGMDVAVMEAIYHVVEHFSMHTGQIILLTKWLSGKEMSFYDLSSGVPIKLWLEKKN